MFFLFFKGLILSGSIYVLGSLMDIVFEINTLYNLIENNNNLYHKMETSLQTNFFIVSPISYVTINTLFVSNSSSFSLVSVFVILFIHNYIYYKLHYAVHHNSKLYKIHLFHHKFDKLIIPSVANAVSVPEFLLLYISPLVPGILITGACESSLVMSVALISVKNLAIHTPKLSLIPKIPYINVPNDHLLHHSSKSPHYSATYFDFDQLEETLSRVYEQAIKNLKN